MRNTVDDDECEALPRQSETTTVNCGVLVLELENIEEMRRRRGITDDKLRDEIRGLAVGDQVRLTLATGAETFSGKTLLVRITTIKGQKFHGELTKKAVCRQTLETQVNRPSPSRRPIFIPWCWVRKTAPE